MLKRLQTVTIASDPPRPLAPNAARSESHPFAMGASFQTRKSKRPLRKNAMFWAAMSLDRIHRRGTASGAGTRAVVGTFSMTRGTRAILDHALHQMREFAFHIGRSRTPFADVSLRPVRGNDLLKSLSRRRALPRERRSSLFHMESN